MTTDGGGWTRVVGINVATLAHSNSAAVPFAPDPSGDGKLSDSEINGLRSSITTEPVFRFTCNAKTVYFPGSCLFDASPTGAAGDCHVFSPTFTSPTWNTGVGGDGCGSNSAYATLSAIVLSAPCGTLTGTASITYRRADWRGFTFDSGGCTDVTGAGSSASGAVFVR
jgi:hypothetical protein